MWRQKSSTFKFTFLPFGVKTLTVAEYFTVKFDTNCYAFLFYDIHINGKFEVSETTNVLVPCNKS